MDDNDWFEGRIADDEMERCQQKRVVFWLAAILVLFLAGGIVSAWSAEVYRNLDDRGGPAVLKLYEKPCTDAKVKAHLFAQLLDDRRFKAATLHYWGRDWASCWAEVTNRHGQKIVISIDEQGSPFQPVPRALFRDESV